MSFSDNIVVSALIVLIVIMMLFTCKNCDAREYAGWKINYETAQLFIQDFSKEKWTVTENTLSIYTTNVLSLSNLVGLRYNWVSTGINNCIILPLNFRDEINTSNISFGYTIRVDIEDVIFISVQHPFWIAHKEMTELNKFEFAFGMTLRGWF
jgi:hypothetical protein